jgi:hypothetical protein
VRIPDDAFAVWGGQMQHDVRAYVASVKSYLLRRGYIGGTSNGHPSVRCGHCALPVPVGHVLLLKITKDEYGRITEKDRWCFECIEDEYLGNRDWGPDVLTECRQRGDEEEAQPC